MHRQIFLGFIFEYDDEPNHSKTNHVPFTFEIEKLREPYR